MKTVISTTPQKSDTARLRFIADMYGLKSLDELDDKAGKYPQISVRRRWLIKSLKTYGLDKMTDSEGKYLQSVRSGQNRFDNIRYEMGKKLYRRYEPTIYLQIYLKKQRLTL